MFSLSETDFDFQVPNKTRLSIPLNSIKLFSKFYYRHSELIVIYSICLKTTSATRPVFYGDLVYKFNRIVGK